MFAAQGLIVQETRSSAHLTERATLWQALSEVNQTSAIFRSTPLINWFRYRICCTSLELQDPKTVPTFAFCLQPMGMASSSPGIFPSLKIKVIVDFSTSRGVASHVSHDQGYQSSLPSPRVISDTIMRFSLSCPTSFTEQLSLFYFQYESYFSAGRATRTRRRARRTPTWWCSGARWDNNNR